MKFHELLTQVKQLADELEQYEDIQLKLDTLEGETDYKGWLSWLYDKRAMDIAFEEQIDQRIKALQERKKSCQNRQDSWKDMIKAILVSTGENKIVMPEFTVSITKGRQSINVIDESRLPEDCFVIKRSPDKKAIADKIASGEAVDGAEVVTGSDTVTIRSK